MGLQGRRPAAREVGGPLDDNSWAARARHWAGIVLAAVLLALLLALAWLAHSGDYYTAGSDLGYNLGLVGGLLMLSLLLYPLRKRNILFDDRWGRMESWFRFHMLAGIAGPILVLFHSTFRTGSMNGATALYAMVLVACSGVVGRFIYRHIHFGLYGRHATLAETEGVLAASSAKLTSVFALLPEIEERLKAFNAEVHGKGGTALARAGRFALLRWRSQRLSAAIRRDIKQALVQRWRGEGGSRSETILNYRLARGYVDQYLAAVVQASQLAVWEKLFSLWHVIHVPFLYLLLISGIVHVLAVHMY